MRGNSDVRRGGGAGEEADVVGETRILAAVDVGTVSTRLALAEVGPAGVARMIERRSTITNLGAGVDATGRLSEESVERTCETIRAYGRLVAARAQAEGLAVGVTCTLTSAARDAANAGELTGRLREMGLAPQVIGGEVEARLALLGVTADFAGTRVLVADSGGGSTELVEGTRHAGGLDVGRAVSLDIGCRRVTERFLAPPAGEDAQTYVPAPGQVASARAFAAETFAPFFAPGAPAAPEVLACVGGTATSLVAVKLALVPYRSERVHLHRMAAADVHALAELLTSLAPEARRALPGLQPKRADVIAAGALILDELLAAGGYDAYTASESDSLAGLLACAYAAAAGAARPLGSAWSPQLASGEAFAEACA